MYFILSITASILAAPLSGAGGLDLVFVSSTAQLEEVVASGMVPAWTHSTPHHPLSRARGTSP